VYAGFPGGDTDHAGRQPITAAVPRALVVSLMSTAGSPRRGDLPEIHAGSFNASERAAARALTSRDAGLRLHRMNSLKVPSAIARAVASMSGASDLSTATVLDMDRTMS
jgi:hypothetical protein